MGTAAVGAKKGWTPERREAARLRMLGNKVSSTPEHKKQLAERNQSAKQIAAVKAALTGVPKSEEHREAISESLTGKEGWAKGVPKPEAQREKISESLKEHFKSHQTPNFKHGLSAQENIGHGRRR
jgi:chorismate mutase